MTESTSIFETLIDFFKQGGPIMWPILLISVAALTVAVERLWALRRSRVIPVETVRLVLNHVAAGRIKEGLAVCQHDGGPFARVATTGLEWWSHGSEGVKEAILDAGRREMPLLTRGLGLVGTVASIAPLLGLLGTVTGMIQVFQEISLTGPGQGQGLSSGIAEALLTTAFGLSVAIPTLVIYNLLASRAERLVHDVETACHDLVRHAAPGNPADDRPAGEK